MDISRDELEAPGDDMVDASMKTTREREGRTQEEEEETGNNCKYNR